MLLKIKVDLGARYLEVLVLPPEGTWILNQRDSSQPERFFSTREIVLNQRDCFADCHGETKILEQDQDGKGKSNQLSRKPQEINDPVYSSLITCFMQSYDSCVLGGGERFELK